MKFRHIFFIFAALAALAVAAMNPVTVIDWFSQTFAKLADGTSFTGQDAVGGSWDAIPEGAAIVQTVAGNKCISFDASLTKDYEICFVATNATCDAVCVDFSVCAVPMAIPPSPHVGDKGGLCLTSTNRVGVYEFAGYTADGWKTLYGRGMIQHKDEWLACRAEFEYQTNVAGVVTAAYVTYSQNLGDGLYLPLADTNGVSRFLAVSMERVHQVVFQGRGHVGDFAGFAQIRNDARNIRWTGATSGDWGDANNWTPKRVPGDGDVALVGAGVSILCESAGGDFFTVTSEGASQRLVYSPGRYLRIIEGDVDLYVVENGFAGVVVADSGTKLRVQPGCVGGLEMGVGSMLVLEGMFTVKDRPFYLDGIHLVINYTLDTSAEAVAVITAPYGSGGTPASLAGRDGEALEGWTPGWHGHLDGSSSLWMENEDFLGNVAQWIDGRWGRLVAEENWGTIKPSSVNAAMMGQGRANLERGESFAFARRFEIGADTNKNGEVVMSGGTVSGDGAGAVVIGARGGTGMLDVVGGTVNARNYLWTSALTIGADAHSEGAVKIGVGSTLGSRLYARDGGSVSVGDGGSASLEIGGFGSVIDEVSADGSVAVGYDGSLAISGGRLIGRESFYVGRTAREEPYDVSMTVSGGTVRNEASGSFWVGSYGGFGSKVSMAISGGQVCAMNRFVCGGYRSASVAIAGGSLVAPEIRIGHALIDENDYAAFTLMSGRVETAGFTSGTNGVRSLVLAGGHISAMATNEDFFAGLDIVRLDGVTTIENASNIVIRTALSGPGGLIKAGDGTNTVAGYAAWAGSTVVSGGVLDMDGGMILGELELGTDAAVVNAKYDTIDALLPFMAEEKWTSGIASKRAFVYVDFSLAADGVSIAEAVDADGMVKGAVKSVVDEGPVDRSFYGWTALGWMRLGFQDGSAIEEGVSYDLRMMFDFREGKPYVMYYVSRGGTYERMIADGGLSAFPVAGELLSITTFSGVEMTAGKQLYATAGREFFWIGPDGGAWNDGDNWSFEPGGAPAGKYPDAIGESGSLAVVERNTHISVPSAVKTSLLMLNADVKLTGDGALSVSSAISGAGELTLSNVTLQAAATGVPVTVPVMVASGTANKVLSVPPTWTFVFKGSLRGTGELALTALNRRPMGGTVLAGDNKAFGGILKIYPYWADGMYQKLDMPSLAGPQASSARAQWEINVEHDYAEDLYPGVDFFGAADATYRFGSLKADFRYTSDSQAYWAKDNVTLEVGDLDLDGYAVGTCAGKGGAIDWMAPTATFRNGVKGLSALRLRGGGRLIVDGEEELPRESITFMDRGGELFFDGTADISGLITNSTAPVVFNGGDGVAEWNCGPDASNVAGFVKRGKGTLVWCSRPVDGMDVSVEEGILVVPFGTRFGHVTVSEGTKILVECSDAVTNAVCFYAAGANRLLDDRYLALFNEPEGYEYTTLHGTGNAIVIVNGSSGYEWTGASNDSLWSSCNNWTVGKLVPSAPPSENDTVFYGLGSPTTQLDSPVSVLTLASVGDNLTFTGANSLRVQIYLDVEGTLGLDPSPMTSNSDDGNYYGATNRLGVSVASAACSVCALTGEGRLSVGDTGDLSVFLAEGRMERFIGTLEAVNFTKRGKGVFEFIGDGAFSGTVSVERGTLRIGSYRNIDGCRMDFDASDEASIVLDDDENVDRWTSKVGAGEFVYAAGQRAKPTRACFEGRNAVMLRPDESLGVTQYSRYDLAPANAPGSVSKSLFMVYVPLELPGGVYGYAQSGGSERSLRVYEDTVGRSWYCPMPGFGPSGIFTGDEYASKTIVDEVPVLTFWSDTALEDTAGTVESLGTAQHEPGLRAAIGEIVAFNRTLTHAEREVTTRQLMAKWGVPGAGDCMGIRPTTPVTMLADATLDLCGQTVKVGSFTGAGTIANGHLQTSDGKVTQLGGDLTLSAVDGMTYVASKNEERLIIKDAAGKKVRIVVPHSWFTAGGKKRKTFFCESENIIWDVQLKTKVINLVNEGEGWWTIEGFGFTVRIR